MTRNSARLLRLIAALFFSWTFPGPTPAQTVSFQPAVNYPVVANPQPMGANPEVVAVADFNGDGRLDLAVVNRSNNTVSVLLGNGDGTFQAARNFPVGSGPTSVAVGDFNGDRRLDLAVANCGSNTVAVQMGNGDGAYDAAPDIDVRSM